MGTAAKRARDAKGTRGAARAFADVGLACGLWDGLMAPSDEAWRKGAEVFADAPLEPEAIAGPSHAATSATARRPRKRWRGVCTERGRTQEATMAHPTGERLRCDDCGAEIVFVKACDCPEREPSTHKDICCGKPMRSLGADAPRAEPSHAGP